MKKYYVKLNADHNAEPNQVVNGYLGENGVKYCYSRGEAIKKARMFGGGKIELVELSTVITEVTMMQIPENALLTRIENELIGREAFKDATDMDEKIYQGGVFQAIAGEFAEMKRANQTTFYPQQKVIDQLDLLCQLVTSDYVMIVKR